MTTPSVSGIFWPTFVSGHDINWSTDTFKSAGVKSTWDPTLSGNLGYSSISGHEVSGTGYTAGGVTVTPTVNMNGKFQITLSADIAHTGAILSDYAFNIVYSDTATAPVAKPIIAIIVCSVSGANNGGTFTIPLPDSPAINTLLYIPGAS